MIDTGSSVSLVLHSVCVGEQELCHVFVSLMDNSLLELKAKTRIRSLKCESGIELGPISVFVVETLPKGVEIVLGLDYRTQCLLN